MKEDPSPETLAEGTLQAAGASDPLGRCKDLIEKLRNEIAHEDDENYWASKLGLTRAPAAEEDRDGAPAAGETGNETREEAPGWMPNLGLRQEADPTEDSADWFSGLKLGLNEETARGEIDGNPEEEVDPATSTEAARVTSWTSTGGVLQRADEVEGKAVEADATVLSTEPRTETSWTSTGGVLQEGLLDREESEMHDEIERLLTTEELDFPDPDMDEGVREMEGPPKEQTEVSTTIAAVEPEKPSIGLAELLEGQKCASDARQDERSTTSKRSGGSRSRLSKVLSIASNKSKGATEEEVNSTGAADPEDKGSDIQVASRNNSSTSLEVNDDADLLDSVPIVPPAVDADEAREVAVQKPPTTNKRAKIMKSFMKSLKKGLRMQRARAGEGQNLTPKKMQRHVAEEAPDEIGNESSMDFANQSSDPASLTTMEAQSEDIQTESHASKEWSPSFGDNVDSKALSPSSKSDEKVNAIDSHSREDAALKTPDEIPSENKGTQSNPSGTQMDDLLEKLSYWSDDEKPVDHRTVETPRPESLSAQAGDHQKDENDIAEPVSELQDVVTEADPKILDPLAEEQNDVEDSPSSNHIDPAAQHTTPSENVIDDNGLATLEQDILQQFASLKSVFERSRAQSTGILQNVFNASLLSTETGSPSSLSADVPKLPLLTEPLARSSSSNAPKQHQLSADSDSPASSSNIVKQPSTGNDGEDAPVHPSEQDESGIKVEPAPEPAPHESTVEWKGSEQGEGTDDVPSPEEALPAAPPLSDPPKGDTGTSEEATPSLEAAKGEQPFAMMLQSMKDRELGLADASNEQEAPTATETGTPAPQVDEKEKTPKVDTRKPSLPSSTKAEPKNVVGKTIKGIANSFLHGESAIKRRVSLTRKKEAAVDTSKAKKTDPAPAAEKQDSVPKRSSKIAMSMSKRLAEVERRRKEHFSTSRLESSDKKHASSSSSEKKEAKPIAETKKSAATARASGDTKNEQAFVLNALAEVPKPNVETEKQETGGGKAGAMVAHEDPEDERKRAKKERKEKRKKEKAAKKERKEKRKKEKQERKKRKKEEKMGSADPVSPSLGANLDTVKEKETPEPEASRSQTENSSQRELPTELPTESPREPEEDSKSEHSGAAVDAVDAFDDGSSEKSKSNTNEFPSAEESKPENPKKTPSRKMLSWSEEVTDKKKESENFSDVQAVIWWSTSKDAVEVLYEDEDEKSSASEEPSSGSSDYSSYPTNYLDDDTFASELEPQIDFSFSTLKEVTETIVEEAALIRQEVTDAARDTLRTTASELSEGPGVLKRWLLGGTKENDKKKKKHKQKQKKQKRKSKSRR